MRPDQRQIIDNLVLSNYGNNLAGSYYALMAKEGLTKRQATHRLSHGRYHRSAVCAWRNGDAPIPRRIKAGMQREILSLVYDREDVERLMNILDLEYPRRN